MIFRDQISFSRRDSNSLPLLSGQDATAHTVLMDRARHLRYPRGNDHTALTRMTISYTAIHSKSVCPSVRLYLCMSVCSLVCYNDIIAKGRTSDFHWHLWSVFRWKTRKLDDDKWPITIGWSLSISFIYFLSQGWSFEEELARKSWLVNIFTASKLD